MPTWSQRLRADETSITYLLFALGILAWLLTTGGPSSTPHWMGAAANGAVVLLVVSLVVRAIRRLRQARRGFPDAEQPA